LQTTGYDVIHLHWVAHFLDYPLLPMLGSGREPLVWTLHDMNPGTGGCHIIFPGCERAAGTCGLCPGLDSQSEHDVTHATWRTKSAAYASLDRPLCFIAPTDCAREEFLATGLGRDRRVEVIPNAIDSSVYRPIDKRQARTALGLPQDRLLIGVSSFRVGNPVKGLRFLLAAAESLAPMHAFSLVSIGERTGEDTATVEHTQLGRMDDEHRQANFYSAIDLFVHPSTWETFGLVVAEAMACGTPVVAFDIGSMRELVFPSVNGWLVHAGEAQDLARAIEAAIGAGEDSRRAFGEQGRKHVVESFSFQSVAHRHAVLYETLIEEANSAR
jgi:glycosyltransferase involved in cell wall biosynthesis